MSSINGYGAPCSNELVGQTTSLNTSLTQETRLKKIYTNIFPFADAESRIGSDYKGRIYTFVFDIDDVLCGTSVDDEKQIKFFLQKGFVLTAIKTHYIFPGVIELIQSLFIQQDVRVCFFSSGAQSRNEIFVRKLLKCALGKEYYLKIKDTVQILSGRKKDGSTDLKKSKNEGSRIQKDVYGLDGSIKKKCLTKFINDQEDLKNWVFIDDDYTYVAPNQESNYLFAPEQHISDYSNMEENSEYCEYDQDGRMKIPFELWDSNTEFMKHCVVQGKSIGLILNEEECIVGYSHLQKEKYREWVIPLKSNEAIFAALMKHYGKKKFPQEDTEEIVVTKKVLKAAIYAHIEAHNGKTTAMELACNRVCYITGVIFKALESARAGGTLTDFLFPHHFYKVENSEDEEEKSEKFKPLFLADNAWHKKEIYYHYGLEILRKVNPNYEFITVENYKKSCDEELSSQEMEDIKEFHSNEDVGGCCMM